MSDLVVPQDEDKEITQAKIEVATEYYLTPKYKLWEQYYLDKSNKETFGNATKSACLAYGFDPTDPKAYNVAHVIGSKNIRKVTNLRKKYWISRGWSQGRILDLYGKKAVESLDLDLLNSIAKDLGVELPKYEPYLPAKPNGNLTQINGSDIQINFSSTNEK